MNVSPLTLDMMKAIRTTLVLALLLMVTTAQAQRGSWKGELDVQGIKLPLVFHFTDKGCTMDSPAQNVRGNTYADCGQRRQRDGGNRHDWRPL